MHGFVRVWTDDRDAHLAVLLNEGLQSAAIAQHLSFLATYPDRGLNAVKMRLRHHRSTSKTVAEKAFWKREISPWSPDRDIELVHLWQKGLSASQIADTLPFIPSSDDGGVDVILSCIF